MSYKRPQRVNKARDGFRSPPQVTCTEVQSLAEEREGAGPTTSSHTIGDCAVSGLCRDEHLCLGRCQKFGQKGGQQKRANRTNQINVKQKEH